MVNVNFEIQRKQFTSVNMKILGIRAMYLSRFILVAIKKQWWNVFFHNINNYDISCSTETNLHAWKKKLHFCDTYFPLQLSWKTDARSLRSTLRFWGIATPGVSNLEEPLIT